MQVVPILRAGLVPLEQIATVLPAYETHHVGLVRNEETLEVGHPALRLKGNCIMITGFPLLSVHSHSRAHLGHAHPAGRRMQLEKSVECVQASWYLNKLPASFAEDDRVLVSDPMMATGGTMVQV